MNCSKFFIAIILVSISLSSIYAQSNELIDVIVKEETLTYGEAAYLVLSAGERSSDISGFDEAFNIAQEKGWIDENTKVSDPVKLGVFSNFIMKEFKLKGGVMYSLFKSSRYASRELGYKGYILTDMGAYRKLTGREALSIIGEVSRDSEEY